MTYANETLGLSNHFGDTRILDGVDLRIRESSVYGILGPNGAGKTTTVRLSATLLKPTAGTATALCNDVVCEVKKVRRWLSSTVHAARRAATLVNH